MSRLIMHVDMDAFFAAIEQRDDPSLMGKPVVVGALPGTRGVVSTCSYEARAFGVRSAMPISEAYRRCPQAVYLPPDFARYSAASHELEAILDEISPTVEMSGIDEAYLDLTGLERLWGPPEAIGEMVRARVRERLRLTASVGIGPNRLVAKMASDHRKPDGLTVVRPEEVFDFLGPLPIGRLRGVGKVTEEALRRAGIRLIADLRRFDERELCARFGEAAGLMLHRRARGEGRDEVGGEWTRKSVSEETTFERDSTDAEMLRDTMLKLAADVGRRARREGLKGNVVTLKLRLRGFETHTRRQTLPAATASDREIFTRAWELYQASPFAGRPLRLIGCGLAGLEPDEREQLDLFERPEARDDRLYSALDEIRARFGADALRVARVPARRKKTAKD